MHRPRHRPSIQFEPSPQPVLSRVVEASGVGAAAVFISGATKGKRQEDKVWTTNLNQTPHPFLVLSSLPKNYLRKELISHTAPTKNSTGVRIERTRDIALSILFDAIVDGSGEAKTPIERLVVSCSNHPRTGYVGVLRVKDIKGTFTRAVIPGTLVAPFVKLTIFPRDVIRIKVLRVSAVELAFANSWTERRIVEEPMTSAADETVEGGEEEVGIANTVTYPQKAGAGENAGEPHSGNVAAPALMRSPVKVKKSSLVCSTAPISPVEAAPGDGESISDSSELQTQFEHPVSLNVAPVVQAEIKHVREKEVPPLKSDKALGASAVAFMEQKDHKAMKSPVGSEADSRVLLSLSNNAPLVHASPPTRRGKSHEGARAAPSLVEGEKSDSGGSGSNSVETELGRRHVSKALIAWTIKRRLLQDKNIMRSLITDTDAPSGVAQPDLLGRSHEVRVADSDTSGSQCREVSASRETAQARCAWNAVNHWTRENALREVMAAAKTFSVAVARTSEEVVASLSQSCGLQMLFVLSGEAHRPASSSVDCFNLMTTIARAAGRSGRNTELLFRMEDGFACLLHPRRELELKPQWLLVSAQAQPALVSDWLLEALRLHDSSDGGSQSFRGRQSADSVAASNATAGLAPLRKPAVLQSVVDFSSLFELLLPALRAWLTLGDLCYYGDVHPVLRPFIDEDGVIHPTGWFQCVLRGAVRSVLLSLPGAGCDDPREMPPTARRRLACITLGRLVPFSAVWQPHPHAVKVVLSNDHALHHIELLHGVLLDRRELAVAAALSPQSQGKMEPLSDGSTPIVCTSSRGRCAAAATEFPASSGNAAAMSALAFQVLATALRRSWMVVGLSLLPGISFDEDAFMDTVLRWAYAWPRTIVLFYTDPPWNEESSSPFSAAFLEAFAPVAGLRSAIEAVSANP
ncbi:uncharacterized protein Tco025E_00487 [Trypanosoma conorhini]|uniref:Uncharacterized protein n=1 Tax=Trypanosoma conorhini TaxID=83891 RepID=A0A3R7LHD9_9TRYP|nr:uncharacterized protein Tco025E_00487 [Trypanosoma conorhini]RNF27296.1 hypothetical protein Tco025E_00487 [Trypanosoma conorhini]